LPPQQQQSAAAASLASLGALAGIAGGALGVKSPADQYVALMQSVNVSDRIIDRFKLMSVYKADYRQEAYEELSERVRIAIGKKDGLISVAVEDHDPERAAAMANQYVDELRRMTATLALSEAQQRRVFFEKRMAQAKQQLTHAQTALQSSGFGAGALKAEPKAAAETYAKLRAELTAAEVRLQTLQGSLTGNAPEVRQQSAMAQALRQRLGQLEAETNQGAASADYVSRYREFKYQETLFELMAKQFELARVDESREGALIQVVDEARPAERKSRPKRALIALGCAFLVGVLLVLRLLWQRPSDAKA
jgi:capsule polysaccharide export protein KpsE/RkpR